MVNEYAKSLGVNPKNYENQSTFKDEETGLKESHIDYCLGDALLKNPGYTYNTTAFDIFEGTFLYKYSLEVKNLKRDDKRRLMRWDIATKIIKEMMEKGNYEKPTDDEVVVHLRLGDVLLDRNKHIKNIYILHKNKIIREILKHKKNKITLVTASHTARGALDSSEICNERSALELKNIISELEKHNLSVKVRSSGSDVDLDFFYLCHAKNLVLTGRSGFGELAKILNKKLV